MIICQGDTKLYSPALQDFYATSHVQSTPPWSCPRKLREPWTSKKCCWVGWLVHRLQSLHTWVVFQFFMPEQNPKQQKGAKNSPWNTGWFIGTLIMVCYCPYITGKYNPLYTLNNHGPFFHCSCYFAVIWIDWAPSVQKKKETTACYHYEIEAKAKYL